MHLFFSDELNKNFCIDYDTVVFRWRKMFAGRVNVSESETVGVAIITWIGDSSFSLYLRLKYEGLFHLCSEISVVLCKYVTLKLLAIDWINKFDSQ